MMIAVVVFLPWLNGMSDRAPIQQYGGMVLTMPSVGYVLIALLAFVLGAAVTLLCQHWKQKRDREREL